MVLGHIHVNVQMKEHINLGKVSLKAVWEGMSEVHIDSLPMIKARNSHLINIYSNSVSIHVILHIKGRFDAEATAANNFNRKPSLLLSLNYEEPQTMMEMCFHAVSSI